MLNKGGGRVFFRVKPVPMPVPSKSAPIDVSVLRVVKRRETEAPLCECRTNPSHLCSIRYDPKTKRKGNSKGAASRCVRDLPDNKKNKRQRGKDDKKEKHHCRPGGLRPFRPVLVLRLPFRASEGERLLASGLALLLASGCSSAAAAVGALGDLEAIDLMNGKFLNMLL